MILELAAIKQEKLCQPSPALPRPRSYLTGFSKIRQLVFQIGAGFFIGPWPTDISLVHPFCQDQSVATQFKNLQLMWTQEITIGSQTKRILL